MTRTHIRTQSHTRTGSDSQPDPATVWRELGVFLAVQVALTAVTTAIAVQQDADVGHLDQMSPGGLTALFASGFWPTISALVARRVVHGRLAWSGWGFRRTTVRRLAAAWGLVLSTVLGSGALVWVTGVGGFDASDGPVLPVLGLTVVVLPYTVLALGEEVGWRGLVVTRLSQVARPHTVVLLSGVTWSAFHWPMILVLGGTPDGVSPVFAVLAFSVALTAFAAVLASMQLHWGIWPVCVAHAVWNATLYQVLEPLTATHGATAWFGTETGLFLAVTSVLAALLWWRRHPLRSASGRATTVSTRPLASADHGGL